MNDVSTLYRVLRAAPVIDELAETRPIVRFGRGSSPPPPEPRAAVRRLRLGEHDLEVQREGALITIALPGAVRLRGRPDQIRGLAAALVAALDD